MRCFETYDEQNRLKKVEFTKEAPCGKIMRSDGISYLAARRFVEETDNLAAPSNVMAYKYLLAYSTKRVPTYAAWVAKTCPLDQWTR